MEKMSKTQKESKLTYLPPTCKPKMDGQGFGIENDALNELNCSGSVIP